MTPKELPPFHPVEGCHCETCDPIRIEVSADGHLHSPNMRMIVCARCGNKRCPHATNHLHECTNSNEPGQLGSSYGKRSVTPQARIGKA